MSRRKEIRMTPEEQEALLQTAFKASLSTVCQEGLA
ncbi:MAG: hypothetical protein ETSY2_29750 [Candidatus Entotheonella gemina]|uniref:Uncharacterized protein n=1 Tax=Candidatus Entotheonella gemina TaxID=1429439 RepID=W4M3P3_9BACT|nr:MAG: hypothetical protein ETSY2_29750 [Candidatus Entotheonella gemina]